MMDLTFEERKLELINALKQLEAECNLLLERIPRYIDEVSKITNVEEAREFDKNFNIEEGLELIEIF